MILPDACSSSHPCEWVTLVDGIVIPRGNSLLRRYRARLVGLAQHRRADTAMLRVQDEIDHARYAREAMWRAQAADRAKSEFLAHMSHELRTPLNAIIGFSDMLLSAPTGSSEKLAGYIKDINRAGWHLLGVVNDILDLAKIGAGKLDLSETKVDFAALIESSLAMIRGRLEEKRITLERDIDGGLPELHIDELKFKQILLNLLSNAVKFTPAGGRVRVATARRPDAFVIAIADNGIGIAADDLPKILVPFTQLDSKVSRKYEGTGLGLPLTKGLVELHGGSLSIESTQGVGTTVTVRLPAERIADSAPHVGNAAGAAPLGT